MSQIIIKNLNKKIRNTLILNNINLNLQSGNIYGFLGRNGSGKTMLFRAICGLIKPTSGEILIDNLILGENIEFPPSCGVIIETPGFWDNYSAFENLKTLASIKNIITDNDIINILKAVTLDPKDTKPFKKFSLGMKQKLALAQALMEKPDIIILDEPTNALDEESVKIIHNLIKLEKKRGALILIASHNKDDIDSLCDVKFKLDSGKIINL